MQRSCISNAGQAAQHFSSCRNLGDVPHRRDLKCVARAKKKKIKPKTQMEEDAPNMTEGVKASFYLRFSDVLGEDPSAAMRKIVDGGIKIDSDFIETLQKQKKDAEEALKAAKLLAKVSGDTFVDPGLDISMKAEYEKAKRILDSTEQMWDSLQTDDAVKPGTPQDQATSPRRSQDETLEQQILRETLGGSDSHDTAARPPVSSSDAGTPMNLYDRMDALLGSISDGSFSSPSTAAGSSPPSTSAAPPPPLRAPKRPHRPEDEQVAGAAAPTAAAGPTPELASRPALSAASARAAEDDEELTAADLERRAVELEEELFQGGVDQGGLAEAEAVSLVRERLQALRTGEADVGGGGGMSSKSMEDRFPDLSADAISMESLLSQKSQRGEPKPAEPQQPPKVLAERPQPRPPPPAERPAAPPTAAESEAPVAAAGGAAPATGQPDPAAAASQPAASTAAGTQAGANTGPGKQPVPPAGVQQRPRSQAAAATEEEAVSRAEPRLQQTPESAARPAVVRPEAVPKRPDGGSRGDTLEDALERALLEAGKMPRKPRVPDTKLPQKRRKARRGPAGQPEEGAAVERLAPPAHATAKPALRKGVMTRAQRPSAANAGEQALGAAREVAQREAREADAASQSGVGAVEATKAAILRERPAKPKPVENDSEEAAPTAAPPPQLRPSYAMVTTATAGGAHVTLSGDIAAAFLPRELMSQHTARLVEAAEQQKRASPYVAAQMMHLIRGVIVGTERDGAARMSERRAYAFADVGTDEVSDALNPLVAEALLAGEAEVSAVTTGPRDTQHGGYPVQFRPPPEHVGIAQALLDSTGLGEVPGYAVDCRPVRPGADLPLQSRVRARVCRGCLAGSVIKLTILSTEHDALMEKLTFADATASIAQLPRPTLRCFAELAALPEVAGLHVKQLVDSPAPAEQPQVYVGKAETEVGDGVTEREVAVHCQRTVAACAVQSTLARGGFVETLRGVVDAATGGASPAPAPSEHE